MSVLQITPVFASYWKFAAERHRIYEKRLAGDPQPWTADPILGQYKFTNVFRAADRVSQYLIREVIYNQTASTDAEEVVFRILLFKLFNSIPAWEVPKAKFGIPTWRGFNEQAYAAELGQAWGNGAKIWNPAYMQKPQYREDLPAKHERYLALLKYMMDDRVGQKLVAAKSYRQAYGILRGYPLYGDFLAMQHLTDINYSEVIDFGEDDFIVPGPGCYEGMEKCFGFRPTPEQARIILEDFVTNQDDHLKDVGEQPIRLQGKRKLHAIDCQNLFCEVGKYAREAHPEFNLKRTEIKQKLKPAGPLPPPFFPPKWGI